MLCIPIPRYNYPHEIYANNVIFYYSDYATKGVTMSIEWLSFLKSLLPFIILIQPLNPTCSHDVSVYKSCGT